MNKTILLAVLLLLIIGGLGFFMYQANEAASDLSEPALAEQGQTNQIQTADEFNEQHNNPSTNNSAQSSSNALTDLKQANPINIPPILGVRAIGDPNAPVKLTELFSLTCSHCATFHNDTYPLIKKNFVDTGKVYYVYQEFPLNAPALHASMIARCLPSERYSGFIDLLFKTQQQWSTTQDYKSSLRQNAKLAGLSDQEFDACLENKELQEAFAQVISQASQNWQIKSTPTLVFNDGEKAVAGAQSYAAMENALNQFIERAHAMSAIKQPEQAMVLENEEEAKEKIMDETYIPEVMEELPETSSELENKVRDAVNKEMQKTRDEMAPVMNDAEETVNEAIQ